MADLNDLTRDLMNMNTQFRNKKPKLIKDMGERLRIKIQDNTPVDTGRLKGSYRVVSNHDGAEVATDVEYAPYVNDGHMQGSRFIPGVHMYETGIMQFEPEADRLIESFLNSVKGPGE